MHDERLTEKEYAFLNAVKRVWPGGFGYPLNGVADRQTAEDVKRLIERDIVERIEQTGQVVADTGEVVDSATYRLTDDFVGDVGGTPRPQDN
jgi:hypothetical protein